MTDRHNAPIVHYIGLQLANAHRDKYLFGDISCDQMKLNLNCLAIITIVTFEDKKKSEALKTENTIITVK